MWDNGTIPMHGKIAFCGGEWRAKIAFCGGEWRAAVMCSCARPEKHSEEWSGLIQWWPRMAIHARRLGITIRPLTADRDTYGCHVACGSSKKAVEIFVQRWKPIIHAHSWLFFKRDPARRGNALHAHCAIPSQDDLTRIRAFAPYVGRRRANPDWVDLADSLARITGRPFITTSADFLGPNDHVQFGDPLIFAQRESDLVVARMLELI